MRTVCEVCLAYPTALSGTVLLDSGDSLSQACQAAVGIQLLSSTRWRIDFAEGEMRSSHYVVESTSNLSADSCALPRMQYENHRLKDVMYRLPYVFGVE